MDIITLNSGVQLPPIGFGVFESSPEDTVDAVRTALDVGYRHIDTAAAYGNERQVGEARSLAAVRRGGAGSRSATARLCTGSGTCDCSR